MKKKTLFIEFTSTILNKVPAQLWVPHWTVYHLAGEVGAGHCVVLLPAVEAKLALAILVKLANEINSCHFNFLFLKFCFVFLIRNNSLSSC